MADRSRRVFRDVCRITHHNDEAYVGALAIVVAIRQCSAADGVPTDLVASVAAALPQDYIGED